MAPDNIENNGSVHGYAWSDGTVRSIPEPNWPDGPPTPINFTAKVAVVPHVTQETLDKAYAAWLKDYTAWKKRMAEWEAKYGSKV